MKNSSDYLPQEYEIDPTRSDLQPLYKNSSVTEGGETNYDTWSGYIRYRGGTYPEGDRQVVYDLNGKSLEQIQNELGAREGSYPSPIMGHNHSLRIIDSSIDNNPDYKDRPIYLDDPNYIKKENIRGIHWSGGADGVFGAEFAAINNSCFSTNGKTISPVSTFTNPTRENPYSVSTSVREIPNAINYNFRDFGVTDHDQKEIYQGGWVRMVESVTEVDAKPSEGRSGFEQFLYDFAKSLLDSTADAMEESKRAGSAIMIISAIILIFLAIFNNVDDYYSPVSLELSYGALYTLKNRIQSKITLMIESSELGEESFTQIKVYAENHNYLWALPSFSSTNYCHHPWTLDFTPRKPRTLAAILYWGTYNGSEIPLYVEEGQNTNMYYVTDLEKIGCYTTSCDSYKIMQNFRVSFGCGGWARDENRLVMAHGVSSGSYVHNVGHPRSVIKGYWGNDAWEHPFYTDLRNVYVQRIHGLESQGTDQIEIRDTSSKTFKFKQGVYTFDSLWNWPGGPLKSGTIFDIYIPPGLRCVLINHPHATGDTGNSVVFTKNADDHEYLKTIQFQSIIVDWEQP
jgi:hypothetical protein